MFVGGKVGRAAEARQVTHAPDSVVIVGGGAAGSMAAETLRAEGYGGRITIVTADQAEPYDRPNLSKDYLAGNAPEEWLPLRSPEFYTAKKIELLLGQQVVAIDAKSLALLLADGRQIKSGAILLATGADPVRLDMPGGFLLIANNNEC
jgi:NADPH-dependent 2,4-dienoyl-CoA reductase/sulfur reductase-like enzyme